MRRLPVAFVLALALASCSKTLPVVDDIPFVLPGIIVAVTLPESLEAGARVPVYVHWWKEHSAQRFDRFQRVQDGPRHWTVSLVTLYSPNWHSIPVDPCHASPDTFEVEVPATGIDSFTVTGKAGSISFEIAAGNGANDSGHRVLVLDRATGSPLPGTKFSYLDWSAGAVDSGMTDAGGFGRTSPPPCGVAFSPVDFVVTGSSCGEGVVRFEPGNLLCGRAMRTVMIYGPVPMPVD